MIDLLEWECIVDWPKGPQHNWHWCNQWHLVATERVCHHLRETVDDEDLRDIVILTRQNITKSIESSIVTQQGNVILLLQCSNAMIIGQFLNRSRWEDRRREDLETNTKDGIPSVVIFDLQKFFFDMRHDQSRRRDRVETFLSFFLLSFIGLVRFLDTTRTDDGKTTRVSWRINNTDDKKKLFTVTWK